MTRLQSVASWFKAHPGEWIDGLELARFGGCYAHRTRVSECRTKLGMTIENRQTKQPDGSVRSCYRFVA